MLRVRPLGADTSCLKMEAQGSDPASAHTCRHCTARAAELCGLLLRTAETCGDPMFIVDETYNIVQWNAAAESVLGLPVGRVLGRPCFEVLQGNTRAGRRLCHPHCQKWALARRGARLRNFDIHALPDPGIWLNVSILPIRNSSGKLVALGHLVRNVNYSVRLESYVRDLASSTGKVLAGRDDNALPPSWSPAHLTARELEVLRLVARGCDTVTIAETLGISQYTARNHASAVLNKLGLHSRLEAASYAYEHGLL